MINKFFETTDDFNFETEKQNFVENLDMLKTLSVQESTLYKKWQEFNKDEYKMRTKAHKFDIIKSKLWKQLFELNKVDFADFEQLYIQILKFVN